LESTQLPFPPGACPSRTAFKIWNTCRGLDWQALPLLAEIHGVEDIEMLIEELVIIREFQDAGNG